MNIPIKEKRLFGPHVWISIGDECWCKNCGISNEESEGVECSQNQSVFEMDQSILNSTKDALDGIPASPKAIGQIYGIISKEIRDKGVNYKY